MQKIISGILHLFLAALVLSSTTGFVVGQHYCGGKVVHTAFLHKAEGCGMKGDQNSKGCEWRNSLSRLPDGEKQFVQTPCCLDVIQLIQSELPQEKWQQKELQDAKPLPTAPVVVLQSHSPSVIQVLALQHLAKAPPPPLPAERFDLPVFVQSFLL